MTCRLALWWLRDQGYERLGLLGTSLGSCLSFLTTCHEPLVRAQALNHVSPHFGDVVWRGLSTEHVRQGLDGHVDIEQLRNLWRPISPWSFIERLHDKQTLMVYAKYDLSFPVDLSLELINEMRRRRYPAAGERVAVRPLLDRRGAVQVSRRLVSGEVSRDETLVKGSRVPDVHRASSKAVPTVQLDPLNNLGTLEPWTVEPLQVSQQPDQRVVDRSGE